MVETRCDAYQVVPTYHIPSNFELIEHADLIVLARVQTGATRVDHAQNDTAIELSPIEVLKGQKPRAPLYVRGSAEWRGKPATPIITHLGEPHPSSLDGACTRTAYPPGGLLIAMFKNSSTGPELLHYPFARQIEDVDGPNGAWVRAVKIYVEMSQIPPGPQRRKAIVSKIRQLNSGGNDPAGQAIAFDLKMYLVSSGQLEMRKLTPAERKEIRVWMGQT